MIDVVVLADLGSNAALTATLLSVRGQTQTPGRTVVVAARPGGVAWRDIINHASAPWVVTCRAGDQLTPTYLEAITSSAAHAGDTVAALCPSVRHTPTATTTHPGPLDYWALRSSIAIETGVAWRLEAVKLLDQAALPTTGLPQYELALRLTERGWGLVPATTAVITHGEATGVDAGCPLTAPPSAAVRQAAWRARSHAIITLFAGRGQVLDHWRRFLSEAELAPRTSLYVVDNSASPEFAKSLADAVTFITDRRKLLKMVSIRTGRPHTPAREEPYMAEARHRHVARLYAEALPQVGEDIVVTLEDDVQPPADALPRIGELLGSLGGAAVGAVAAAYSTPQDPSLVCAAWPVEGHAWGRTIRWDEAAETPIPVAAVGGGCTAWANWINRPTPTRIRWDAECGWDAMKSAAIRASGAEVLLHGGIRCAHHRHGKLS